MTMSAVPTWTASDVEAAGLLPRVFRAYGLPELYDYERESSGLLIAVGSGLMLATMDAVPSLRYCTDIGGGIPLPRLADAAHWIGRLVPLVVVHAWFSISVPDALCEALPVLGHSPCRLIVRSNALDTSIALETRAMTFHNLVQATTLGQAR